MIGNLSSEYQKTQPMSVADRMNALRDDHAAYLNGEIDYDELARRRDVNLWGKGGYEFRHRREWIVRTATTIAPILPARWQRPFLDRALTFIRSEWRFGGDTDWQPMGRLSVMDWNPDTGEFSVFVHRPEDTLQ